MAPTPNSNVSTPPIHPPNISSPKLPSSMPATQPNLPPASTSQTNSIDTNKAFFDLLQLHKDALDAKKVSSSIHFPKFHGKSKNEFKTWYDQVLAILSSPTRMAVFKDLQTKKFHKDDNISPELSSKLFSALWSSLTGNTEALMMTKHLTWGRRLFLLSTLRDTYKEVLHRADLLKKKKEYSPLFQKSNESIDDFAARYISTRTTLQDPGITTTDYGLESRFLMGLGPLFTKIQQMQEKDLPHRWKSNNIQQFTNAANAYKDEKIVVRERNNLFKETNEQWNPNNANTPNQNEKKG